MVAVTKESNQATTQPSVEDEATKRNTDCVYFLASPLTCKKGSECEYRHSEYARVNPRDCWYWLNGSCLNPKCAFRHPPLDGLLGTQSAVSDGTALPLPQAVAPSPAAVLQSKQVPCIFFQQGLCMKGTRCAFLHGTNAVATKPPQVIPPAAEVTGPKSIFGVPQRNAQEAKVYQPNVSNSNKFTDANSIPKVSNARPKIKTVAERVVLHSGGFNDESLSYNSTTFAPLSSCRNNLVSNRMSHLEVPLDHEMHNSKDADDLYRESSPGFDVLVDDELAEDQYYDEDQYATTRGTIEGRNTNDYGALPDEDHEMFHNLRNYDGYDCMPGQYSRDQSRRSSERILRGSVSLEARNDCQGGNSDRIRQSDLRYRLEQKKGSVLRSCDSYEERRSADSRRDSRFVSPLESSLSSRLHGRMKDIRRSPLRGSGSDRDVKRGRNRSRISPGRTQIRDRLGARVHDDSRNERNSRGYGRIKEGLEDDRGEFSGGQRLSELKGKNSVKDRLVSGQESFSLGKRKSSREHEQLDSDLSFEGPKPLSEILKRKKKSEMNLSGNGSSENKETNATESSKNTVIGQEDPKYDPESEKKTGLDQSQLSEGPNADQEEGFITDNGIADQNMEGYGEGEDGEEYYYEDGGDYDLEEGENAEGEYVDEESGNDFENKISGMLS
ncbi:unnamed protein product [Rhodiola kirilowii]